MSDFGGGALFEPLEIVFSLLHFSFEQSKAVGLVVLEEQPKILPALFELNFLPLQAETVTLQDRFRGIAAFEQFLGPGESFLSRPDIVLLQTDLGFGISDLQRRIAVLEFLEIGFGEFDLEFSLLDIAFDEALLNLQVFLGLKVEKEVFLVSDLLRVDAILQVG